MEYRLLPLVEAIGARYQSLSVDARLVNAFAEKGQQQGEAFVYKRPAFKDYQTLNIGGATGRGLYNWRGDIYAAAGAALYKNGTSLGAIANSGMYSFTSCLGANPVIFMQNGTNAYTVTAAGAIAAVADPNYPAATVGGAVYLDGTTFVMDTTTAAIDGSTAAGNDPATWDPLNKILAQIEPTLPIYLAKQLVYVLALKTNYSEVFYDAGNATGSVLSPVQGAKMNFGCVNAGTVKDIGGDLMWIANSGEGYYCAVMVSGLKLEVVSTPAVDRLLSSATSGTWYSWGARIEGHRLYGVTNTTANFTLVFDLTSRMWYQWTDVNGNYLPYAASCQGATSTTIFQHISNGKLYTLDAATYQDAADGTPFSVDIYTPNYDGGTRRTKTLTWACMVGDQVNTNVSVYTSDDDYATWGSATTVNMNLNQPTVSTLGTFSKRAFHFKHQDNTQFRMKAFEMYIDVGVNG